MGAYTCQFGIVHKVCRCPIPHTIACNVPDEHRPKVEPDEAVEPLTEYSLYDRLSKTLDKWFGSVMRGSVKDSIVTELEQDVADWLREGADRIRRNND